MIKRYIKRWNSRWEGICNRCGKCCYEKHFLHNGTLVIDYDKPCRFLDEEKKLCRVYVNRFNACRECCKVGLFTALFSPVLPPDCAYVQKIRGAFRHPLKTLSSRRSTRR